MTADDSVPEEEDGIAQATAWLEKLTGDPMADAVAGTVVITAVTEPAGHRRYQECTVEVHARAEGVSPRTVSYTGVFPLSQWPVVGLTLPARLSPTHADALEVAWDRLPRT